jgi:hypothetical protein
MNDRTLFRASAFVGATLALALSAHPLHAVPPNPKTLSRLDNRLMRTSRARITTHSGWIVGEGPRAGIEGLTYRKVHATSVSETLPSPGRIPWQETARVDVPSNHALPAALVTGLVVGGLAGVGTYAASQRGEEGGPGGMFVVPIAVLLAAGVGALIPAWHPIYRAPHTSAH